MSLPYKLFLPISYGGVGGKGVYVCTNRHSPLSPPPILSYLLRNCISYNFIFICLDKVGHSSFFLSFYNEVHDNLVFRIITKTFISFVVGLINFFMLILIEFSLLYLSFCGLFYAFPCTRLALDSISLVFSIFSFLQLVTLMVMVVCMIKSIMKFVYRCASFVVYSAS